MLQLLLDQEDLLVESLIIGLQRIYACLVRENFPDRHDPLTSPEGIQAAATV
jgi:hypothetical protein